MDERKNRADVSLGELREDPCDNRQITCQVDDLEGYQPEASADADRTAELKEICFAWRKDIGLLKRRIKEVIENHPHCRLTYEPRIMNREYETLDNMVIAYRKLEDARMRLGKVVQALDGSTSVYPR